MRVLIDTTYAARAPLSGTAVYIRKLCETLEHQLGVEVVQVVNARRRPPAGGGIGSGLNLLSDARWTVRELPRQARHFGADLIHHPLPALSPLTRQPQVVTVVDLAFERLPRCFDRRFRAYAHLVHRAAVRRAGGVISISQTTAADVQELWGVSPGQITVAPLGPGQELSPAERARAGPPRHFLYVGDDEPRKNLPTLMAGYRLYRQRSENPLGLVLAGSASARGEGVSVEPAPGAKRLGELHAAAAALIQPSLYEGFGLTALEAMSVGTPVLAARSPGLVEVCGEAALWADPCSPQDFAQQLSRLADDAQLRAGLTDRGARRAQEFSWTSCARAHLRAYSLALDMGVGRA